MRSYFFNSVEVHVFKNILFNENKCSVIKMDIINFGKTIIYASKTTCTTYTVLYKLILSLLHEVLSVVAQPAPLLQLPIVVTIILYTLYACTQVWHLLFGRGWLNLHCDTKI